MMRASVLLRISQHTKFEIPGFTSSKDMIGAKFKRKLVTWPWPRPLWSSPSSKAKHLTYSTCIQNLATVASVVPEIWLRVSKLKNGSRDPDHAPIGVICHP